MLARWTLALALVVAVVTPGLAQQAPGWTQPHADAAGSGAVDYPTVTADPLVAWRLPMQGLVAGPVSWDRTVYLARRVGAGRELLALDLETGEVTASADLGRGEGGHLAVFQGTVLFVEPDGLRTFTHKAGKLRSGKRVRGAFTSAPCLVGSTVLITTDEGLAVIELTRGKQVATIEEPLRGRPAFRDGRLAAQVWHRGQLAVSVRDALDLGARKPSFGEPTLAELERLADGPPSGAGYVAWVGERKGDEVWFVRADTAAAKRYLAIGKYGEQRGSVAECDPAIAAGLVVGVSSKGTLVTQTADGSSDFYAGAEVVGGVPRRAALADGVVLLGSWAAELGGKRVLWELDELDPKGLLLPVAPGWAVGQARDGALVGITGAAAAAEAETTTEVAAGPLVAPDAGDGLIDADGRFHPGEVRELEDAWQVTPDEGAPAELPVARVAWVEREPGSHRVGDEHPVFVAWRDVLDARTAEALVAPFEAYAAGDLLADCRRLLDEMRARGLDDARARELARALTGMTQSTAANADRKRQRFAEDERAAREEAVTGLLEAAAWCADRQLETAATALLAHAGGVLPDVDEVAARAGALLPEGFPWAEEPDAAQRWMTWATEILPAGATFLPVDHPEWEAVEGTVWGKDTIGFETGNLVFLSRSEDAAVVGRCLRNGEGTVRVLEGLLAATRSDRGKIAPFRVRLHKNRPQYIAEDGGSASTLGYYVPREQVSRFFVPDADVSDPLGRQLHEVLSHELTHQYIAERWIGAADTVPRQEGYWIVEGFARFIDDQITELGRRGGPKLDDPTVPSVETMVALAEEQGWHPFEDLVDWTQTDFIRLPNHELMASVRLRTTLGVRSLSPVGMFYDQGGALVFFLMHHRGAEGRAQLIEYMREYYEEGATQQGWEQLGFATAQELETAFLEFLTELAE